MTNKKAMPAGRQGFTLIELLIVISIIGILASLVIASMGGAQKQARDTQRKSDLNQYRNALETYAANSNGLYPAAAAAEQLTTTCTDHLSGFMSVCLDDPKTPTKHYYYQASVTKYVIYTTLEKGTGTGYWYVCSTGKNGELAITPVLDTECP